MNDADKCERCGKLMIDHTIREMRVCHPAEDLNLSFEENEITYKNVESHAGGLVVLSGVIDSQYGKFPALVFRFAHANGIDFYPDITLVLDETSLRETAVLVDQCVRSAIRATKS